MVCLASPAGRSVRSFGPTDCYAQTGVQCKADLGGSQLFLEPLALAEIPIAAVMIPTYLPTHLPAYPACLPHSPLGCRLGHIAVPSQAMH